MERERALAIAFLAGVIVLGFLINTVQAWGHVDVTPDPCDQDAIVTITFYSDTNDNDIIRIYIEGPGGTYNKPASVFIHPYWVIEYSTPYPKVLEGDTKTWTFGTSDPSDPGWGPNPASTHLVGMYHVVVDGYDQTEHKYFDVSYPWHVVPEFTAASVIMASLGFVLLNLFRKKK